MVTLIIAEKPAAAEKIASALGTPIKRTESKVSYYEVTCNKKDLIVAPAVGHLFTLAQKQKSWKYPGFDLEWKPTCETDKAAAFARPYLQNIKKLAKTADEFIVATDYDIEGEVIGLNIIRFLCNQKDAKRMKFSTLTKQDLKLAYENVSATLDWGQAYAGETRHYLDYYYGVNLSKAITDSIFMLTHRYNTLSIGRVQGPALAMLAERELEIGKFKPKKYWQVYLVLNIDEKEYEAYHEEDKFWEESEAKKIFEKVKDKIAAVAQIKQTEQNVNPPVPFDLTALQIEAYRVFRIAPKLTLSIAQTLYTAAYISYPRTSSQKLPPQLNYKAILSALAKQKVYTKLVADVLHKSKLVPNEGKKTDPAHPAIYPTGEIPKALDEKQKKIYDLIVKRFLAVFGDVGKRKTTTVTFDVEREKFILKGTITIEPGWQALYAPYVRKEEIELPAFEKGEKYKQKTKNDEKKTEPPKRYTAASVIGALEKENLGTKATRAQIIDTLFQRGYVQEKSIRVTTLGMEIYDTFQKYAVEILSKDLTRKFETALEQIRERNMTEESVLDEAKIVVTKICAELDANKAEIGKVLLKALLETKKQTETLMVCPKCSKGNVRVIHSSKTGKRFLACSNYPACKNTYPLPQKGKLTMLKVKCAECNTPKISVYAPGRKPWQFCPNMDCKSRTKSEATEPKAIEPKVKLKKVPES